MKVVESIIDIWSPSSWRSRPARQVPTYPNQACLESVEAQLGSSPPLVLPSETRHLKAELARVAEGKAFLLQGGDCAESFAEFSHEHVLGTARVLLQMARVLSADAEVPVVTVGRIAGQFAKPRSAPSEIVDGVELPSYRGDIINGPEFSAEARTPAPERLLRAYHQSAVTMNLLCALTQHCRVGLHGVYKQNFGFGLSSPERGCHRELAAGLRDALPLVEARDVGQGSSPAPRSTELFTSHEALLLHYEQALTRKDTATGDWYDGSAHMLWLGDRTRQADGAHVEFLRGVANPLGIKVGPTCTPDGLLRLIDRLNPSNEPGRISLIARMGADLVEAKLPPLVRAVQREGKVVAWACDPMHGNTIKVGQYKTRPFDLVASEVRRFFAVHRALGTHAGGVHLEMTGKDVTECIGGAQPVLPSSVGERYHTACDPRLNENQSLELSALIAKTLGRGRWQVASRASASRSSERERYPVEGPGSNGSRPAARALRSIATVSLGGSLPEKLEAIAAAGFDGVEIFEDDLLGSALRPSEVRQRAADLGLDILLFQPLRDIEGVENALFYRNLDRARRCFDTMEALGCDLVLVCSNVSPDALSEAERASEQLGILADSAAERGLRIGYEALAWGRHVRRWREAFRLVDAARRSNLGLIVDSFHTLALDDDFEGLRKLPDGAIVFIQLTDAPRLAMDHRSWSRHHRCFPGQGALPVARFLAAAQASGYTGPVSLEIFNEEYRTKPPGAVALDGIRSLLRLEESLAAESKTPVRPAPAPPPRVRPAARANAHGPE